MPKRKRSIARELSTRGLTSHDLRRVQKLNDTLRRTRALVAKSEDPEHSISLLLAETRVLILEMGRYEFGQVAGMHFHAVKNAETPGSHPQHESLSRVYRTWGRLAEERGQSRGLKKQLTAISAKLLDLLVPEQDEQGRPFRASVDGLYRVWMYQKGRQAFEAASRKTNRARVPLTYGTLWQRREVGMVPNFEEVRVIGESLGCDLKPAGVIWDQHKTKQLLARDMPAPLVRFTIAIQLAHPGLRMTAASIRKHLKVTEKTAQAINNGQMIGFRDIERVVKQVYPKQQIAALKSQWVAELTRMETQEDFATAFPRVCHENAWNNHMLATLLRVRPPEERAKKRTKPSRNEVYRPSAEIRRMYQENAFSGQAPAKAAIDLVARNKEQAEYLANLFLDDVGQRLFHKGSAAHASPVRRHRIFCGVLPQELAQVSDYSKAEILHLERGLSPVTASEEKRLIKLIETFPDQKVRDARARLTELTSPPRTVIESITRLRDRHGGYVPMARVLHDEADRRLSLSPVHLKRIEQGEEIPPLPLLRHLVTRGGSELTEELVADWYRHMPEYLATNNKLQWKHPLVRGFGMVVYEKWHSLHAFWEEQFQEDFSYSIVTRNFQQLNGRGYDFPWTTVSRYLNAAGVGVADPRRKFLQQLFDRKDEITEAIASRDKAAPVTIVKKVLSRWRKDLRAARRDPGSCEHTLGLTAQERGITT